jgi:hypothetical protein
MTPYSTLCVNGNNVSGATVTTGPGTLTNLNISFTNGLFLVIGSGVIVSVYYEQ